MATERPNFRKKKKNQQQKTTTFKHLLLRSHIAFIAVHYLDIFQTKMSRFIFTLTYNEL